MQRKLRELEIYKNEAMEEALKDIDSFSKFLTLQSKLHKYSFSNALLIYSQNQDTEACATVEEWNRVGRKIKKGTKAIYIFDESKNRYKCVFEKEKTYGKELNNITEIKKEYEEKVLEKLDSKMDNPIFEDNFNHAVATKGFEILENIINGCSEGTQAVLVENGMLILDSIIYTVNARYGMDSPMVEDKLFNTLRAMEDSKNMQLIGNIISETSGTIIEEINIIIKNERSREYEIGRRAENFHGNTQGANDRNRGIVSGVVEENPTRTGATIGRNNDEGQQHNRGSNDIGISERANISEFMGQSVGNQYEGIPSGAESGTGNDRQMAGHAIGSEPGSNGHVLEYTGEIREDQSTATDHGHNGSDSLPPAEEGLRNGNNNGGNSQQTQIDLKVGDLIAYDEREYRVSEITETMAVLLELPPAIATGIPGMKTAVILSHLENNYRKLNNEVRKEPLEFMQGSFFEEINNEEAVEAHEDQQTYEAEETHEDKETHEDVETHENNQTSKDNPTNFTITDISDLGKGSGKTKFTENIQAIELIKTLEKENRNATEEEQKVLAKFSGFGSLPQAFDPDNQQWKKEYLQLKELLTEEEYDNALESTLNAHYTHPQVIKAIYEGLEQLGFKGGNVLEPSMGTGNFFGMLPNELKESTRLYGVELDPTTGAIAKNLYPQSNVQITGFENASLQDNFFDIAIGNVPFGDYKVNDPKFNKHNMLIHDYFFAKALDKVKPNGVVAFITSSGTMDKENVSVRKYLAERAELLGAIRLPNNAFKETAGTEVTSDIIFLKKRDRVIEAMEENWIYTNNYKTEQRDENGEALSIRLNEYFIQNPQMMMGEMTLKSGRFGMESTLQPFQPLQDVNEIIPFTLEEKYEMRFNEMITKGSIAGLGKYDLLALKDYAIKEKGLGENVPFGNYYNAISDSNQEAVQKFINKDYTGYEIQIERRFEDLRNNNSYSSIQKEWLNRFEANAKGNNRFDNESFDVGVLKREGGFKRMDSIFNNELQSIIDYVNYTSIDKSEIPLNELLSEAVKKLPQNILDNSFELADLDEVMKDKVLPADPTVKNFSNILIDGEIYQRENSIMKPVTGLKDKEIERIKSLIEIRDTARKIIDLQLYNCTDEELKEEQIILNNQYDKFIKDFNTKGISTPHNAKLFGSDSDFPLLCSLEIIKEDKMLKADIFSKRTIAPFRTIESVENSVEALHVSMNEKGNIDLDYMANLSKKDHGEIISDLKGLIYKNPITDDWEPADQYLSGEVVKKLEQAKDFANLDPFFNENIKALEEVQPQIIEAHDIEVRIGSSWIDLKYYEEFLVATFNPRLNEISGIKVQYSEYTGSWKIDKPYSSRFDVISNEKYGTKRMNGYDLTEKLLNQKQPKIFDKETYVDADGKTKERQKLNTNETIAIKNKANLLNQEFKKWIFAEPKRREELVEKYNTLFNSTIERKYDGGYLTLKGSSPFIELRPHQKNAVARTLQGGNTLLAHTVGSGKTYTISASAMEMKRLGLVNKPMIIVPNNLVVQWVNEFKKLYPTANILSATEKDFEKSKRLKFCGRIATGDWDAVIMGHSSFGLIPMSKERQTSKIKQEIAVITKGLEEAKRSRDQGFNTKELARLKKNLEVKLKKIMDSPKDNVINFEELGVDCLYVDEAHNFKNKFVFTKMNNVAGLSTSSADKSTDLDLKCEFINELHKGDRGLIFATGTPISNSMTEMYTMQSYLQKSLLKARNLMFFDNWASNFGEVTSSLEITPTGTGLRTRDRFAKFVNLPELVGHFKQFADIQTADMLKLDVPELKDGKPITISAKPSEQQLEYVDFLVDKTEKIRMGALKPTEFNMLNVTNLGRLCALDMRTINPALEDFPNYKVNMCVENVFDIYKKGEGEKLTQMIFCDLSTPKNKENGKESFSVYYDIKEKLINLGVPKNEIAFIHEANNTNQKESMIGKMRTGELRVSIGSTMKMGEGVNAQTKLVALHNLDCPWKPSHLEQRAGRIVRQGNENEEVQIYNYVTEKTFDSYLWQTVKTKQAFISQIMTSNSHSRTAEDIDKTELNYSEVMAIATGNPKILRKAELENKLQELQILEKQYNHSKHQLEDNINKHFTEKIAGTKERIKHYERDIEARGDVKEDEVFSMKLGQNTYTEKQEAGAIILKTLNSQKYIDKVIGEYKGFKIIPKEKNMYSENQVLVLQGSLNHQVEIGGSSLGAITRMDNVLKTFEENCHRHKDVLVDLEKQLTQSQEQVKVPFEFEEEIIKSQEELLVINAELDIGKEQVSDVVFDENAEVKQVVNEVVEEFEVEEFLELDFA